jgi:hypothetical protein
VYFPPVDFVLPDEVRGFHLPVSAVEVLDQGVALFLDEARDFHLLVDFVLLDAVHDFHLLVLEDEVLDLGVVRDSALQGVVRDFRLRDYLCYFGCYDYLI